VNDDPANALPTERAPTRATAEIGATPSVTRRATAARSPSRTPETTDEITTEVTIAAVVPMGTSTPLIDYSPSPGYREERWYAMTLGIIMSVIVIALGMVVNIGRSLLRKRG